MKFQRLSQSTPHAPSRFSVTRGSRQWETGALQLRAGPMKALSVLGSTGSIGTQTLELVEEFPDRFRVVALTAGNNLDLLIEQIHSHAPEAVALAEAERLPELRDRLTSLDAATRTARLPELLGGPQGLEAARIWRCPCLISHSIGGKQPATVGDWPRRSPTPP